MTAKKAKPFLLWAVDPLEKETRPPAASYAAIRGWAESLGWEIQPVTVATPSAKDLERGLLGSVNHFQAALDAYLKSFPLPNERRGRVLVNEQSTQEAAVAKLLRFAAQEGAAAIAVSSHGRSGLDRLVLGSFAERVLATSPLPVFFLGHVPARKAPGKPVALFPTNFSAESHAAFREFLATAAGTGLEVKLFHAIAYPLPPATGMGMVLPDDYIADQEKWAAAEGRRWVEEAQRAGLTADALVRTGGVGFLSGEAVLEAAAELKATMIVMTAKSGPVGRLLLGSVAFPVFRANRYLTMVYGPKAAASVEAGNQHGRIAQANG